MIGVATSKKSLATFIPLAKWKKADAWALLTRLQTMDKRDGKRVQKRGDTAGSINTYASVWEMLQWYKKKKKIMGYTTVNLNCPDEGDENVKHKQDVRWVSSQGESKHKLCSTSKGGGGDRDVGGLRTTNALNECRSRRRNPSLVFENLASRAPKKMNGVPEPPTDPSLKGFCQMAECCQTDLT